MVTGICLLSELRVLRSEDLACLGLQAAEIARLLAATAELPLVITPPMPSARHHRRSQRREDNQRRSQRRDGEQRQGSVERMNRWSANAWRGGGGGGGGGEEDKDEDDDDEDDDDDDDDDDDGGGGGGGSGVGSARHEVIKSLRQSCVSFAAKCSVGRGGVITSGPSVSQPVQAMLT